MKYKYLIGHNIKAIIKDSTGEYKFKGYITKVTLDWDHKEIIYVKEDNGKLKWFLTNDKQVEIISLKILDTKYTRFEIMDI